MMQTTDETVRHSMTIQHLPKYQRNPIKWQL
ncbi:unnamed protein product [Nezara viridula]|uniref:Uncharacterized protein n=1 Tax=Nezara viridula TaxID=85310 RepID=A0A9P0DYE2_NEZVI|nr:unnamed protein product [Nezara viridula]